MTTSISEVNPIECLAGVHSVNDRTQFSTPHYVDSDKIRWNNGKPEKIKGWLAVSFSNSVMVGTCRSVYSQFINGKHYLMLGTHKRLYSVIGGVLTNITPLQTSSTAVANSLDTVHATLGSNPFTTVSGSSTVTVTDSVGATKLKAGDTVTYTGTTGFAGFSAGDFNADHIVRSTDSGAGTYTIILGSNASSSTSGGGASVVRATGLIVVNDTAHGQADGDRVKMEAATATGGITAGQINIEFEIRNVLTDSFDIYTAGTSTSAVTGGGGASTVYYPQLADGNEFETAAQGYGAGLYGVGLYGTALVSSNSRQFPRIWHNSRFGDDIISTAGNQTGVYTWDGDNSAAPALIANAPTAVNYAFVSNNILVTFGDSAVENRIKASDQGAITQWTSSSENQVFSDDIEGAGKFISHVPVEDYNLIFTENQTYTFRYIGLPFVWEVLPKDETVGIIAPMARISVNGVAFWMGTGNFYMHSGGNIEIMPSNNPEIRESTLRNKVFEDLNYGQKSQCFAWYNEDYNEVWFHYPSAASDYPDKVAVCNLDDFTWYPHNLTRTAAESFAIRQKNPWLADRDTIYKHELGTDDNGVEMPWSLKTKKYFSGKSTLDITNIIPDSSQIGDVSVQVDTYQYPQSTATLGTQTLTITPSTTNVPINLNARVWQYTLSGSALSQTWMMGQWYEEIQKGSTQ